MAHAATSAFAQNPQAADDQKHLQGIWRVADVANVGGPRMELYDLQVAIEGNKLLTVTDGEPQPELTYSLDPTKDPRQIDLMLPQPRIAGQQPPLALTIARGIYALEQGRLRIRIGQGADPRPTDFSVKAATDAVLTLERDASPAARRTILDARAILAIRQLGVRAFSEGRRASRNLYVTLDASDGDPLLAKIAPQIRALDQVTGLHLNGSRVTDAGLASLEGIDNIGHINLAKTAIGDAGLSHLKKMTHLGLLIVSNTYVTDAGLASLKQSLPHLRITNLTRLESDAETAIIEGGGTLVSDEGGKLTEIRFTRGNVKDATLQDLETHLKVWRRTLRSIDLANSPITDQGLRSLTGLTALRQLNLKGTDVTVSGVKYLKQFVPKLKVQH
jgi:uncharacterized protein (TIGR03067 family)